MKRVVDRQELARIAEDLRQEGKRIVTTNGCFDILHVGHVRVLEASRALGDILIVGVNSDASVSRLKGPNRPVNSEIDRAEVLSNLRSVDYVSIFTEDTAEEFLAVVKPDVYTKGADYTPDSLKETPIVEKHGGKVVILDLVPGKSTTATISRINCEG